MRSRILIIWIHFLTTCLLYAQETDSIIWSQTIKELEVTAPRWVSATHNDHVLLISQSKQAIAFQLPQTSADLLNFNKGVYIQKSQQGGGSPMIRGLSANRLLYVVDGVRMNTAIFRSGNLQNVISLDPYALERADVIFGPASVQYGSDALGGLMSFQSLKARLNHVDKTLKSNGRVLTKTSSGNRELTGHLDFNIYNNHWSWVSSISRFHYGDIRIGAIGRGDHRRLWFVNSVDGQDVKLINGDERRLVPSAYDQWNVLQKLRFQPSDKIDFEFIYQYSQTGSFDRYDRLIATRNGNPRYGEWKYGPQKWQSFILETEWRPELNLANQINFSVGFQNFEESRISRNFQQNNRQIRSESVDAFSINLDLSKQLTEKHSIWYGVESVYNKVASSGIDQNISNGNEERAAPRYPNSTWNSLAGYFTGKHEINPHYSLNYGARWNRFGLSGSFENDFYKLPFDQLKLDQSDLSYSLGLGYRKENWNWSVNISKGFRAPNVDDAGKIFESSPGFVIVPNPGLQSEKAYQLELNINVKPIEQFQLDFSGYFTYLDDALVRRNASFQGADSILYDGIMSKVQSLQNAAFARVAGFYTGLVYRPMEYLKASAHINVQKGIEETEDGEINPLRHAPPVFGMIGVDWDKNGLKLGLNGTFNGELSHDQLPEEERIKTEIYALDGLGETFSPSWFTLNFKSSYSMKNGMVISGGIENIFDLAYQTYASGIAAQGRSFMLGLTFQW